MREGSETMPHESHLFSVTEAAVSEALATFSGSRPIFIDGRWVNYAVGGRDFKYYIFDWDDNILFMPTAICMEKRLPDGSWVPHRVSTALFSVVREDSENYRPPNGNWDQAFVEFKDREGSASGFIADTQHALEEIKNGTRKKPPSFDTFKKTLVEGRLFAIVTARGHSPEVLRSGVTLFIDRVLNDSERALMMMNLRGYRYCFDHRRTFGSDAEELDYYLSLNRYHAVTSPGFNEFMNSDVPGIESQEVRKQFAIRDFIDHIVHIMQRTGIDALKRHISMGFSDNDAGNVNAVERYIKQELVRHFPTIKFCVYDTSDAENQARKIVVSGQGELDLEAR